LDDSRCGICCIILDYANILLNRTKTSSFRKFWYKELNKIWGQLIRIQRRNVTIFLYHPATSKACSWNTGRSLKFLEQFKAEVRTRLNLQWHHTEWWWHACTLFYINSLSSAKILQHFGSARPWGDCNLNFEATPHDSPVSYILGSCDSPVSYVPEKRDFPVSYTPGSRKIWPAKNPKWSYIAGSHDSPVSYAPGSQDSPVSYVPGSRFLFLWSFKPMQQALKKHLIKKLSNSRINYTNAFY